MVQKIEITTSTLLRFILLILGIWFIYLIRDVLVLLFFVLIIVAGLSPTVDRWSKTITRPGAVISVFVIMAAAMALIFSLIVPPFIQQLQQFGENLPAYADQIANSQQSGFVNEVINLIVRNVNSLSAQLSDLGSSLLTQTLGLVNGLVAILTVLVLTFYLLLEEEGLKKIYKGLTPAEWHSALAETTRKIAGKLGAWLRGQIFLMLAVGVATTIGLLIIGSPYALTLGVWAGLTEVIPIVGPWIGAVPGVVIGIAESPLQGFLALLVYLVIQQLEGNVLVPKIMAKAVGLNPVIVIIAILVGGKLYGLMGVLLAVPLAAAISVVAEDWDIIRQTFLTSTRRK